MGGERGKEIKGMGEERESEADRGKERERVFEEERE
jgi:hypothetical protein